MKHTLSTNYLNLFSVDKVKVCSYIDTEEETKMIIFDKVGNEFIGVRVTKVSKGYLLTVHDIEAGETFPTKYMFDDRATALTHADELLKAFCVEARVSHE